MNNEQGAKITNIDIKRKIICQYCNTEIKLVKEKIKYKVSKYQNGDFYVLRYRLYNVKVDGKTLKVCKSCYSRYHKYGKCDGKAPPRVTLPPEISIEDRNLRARLKERKKSKIYKERVKMLKSMLPDELLKIIDDDYEGL